MTIQVRAAHGIARGMLAFMVWLVMLACSLAISARAQGFDCQFTRNFTAPATSIIDNRAGCISWQVIFFTSGVTTNVWTIEGAEDNRGSPGTSWSLNPPRMPDVGIAEGVNPTRGSRTYVGYMPWIRINVTTLGGTNPTMTVKLFGKRGQANDPIRIQGQINNASIPAISNPAVVVAGLDDNGAVRPILTEFTGGIRTTTGGAPRRCSLFQGFAPTAGTTSALFTFTNQTLSICSYVVTSDVAGTVRIFIADIGTCAAPTGVTNILSTGFIAANGNISYSGGGISPVFEVLSTKQLCVTAGAANNIVGHLAYVLQ